MDTFERRYTLGVLDELAEPEPEAPSDEARHLAVAAASAEAFALLGCVLTPEKKIEDGHVIVSGGKIAAVGKGEPEGVRVVETEGVILPGLIDLHGHPEYNVFAAWEPPKLYQNRYRWRGSDTYKEVVRKPWTHLTDDKPSLLRDLTRYAEARALVGGVTAIQGASQLYPSKEEALVRNVDLPIFGQHAARALIDPLDTPDDKRQKILDGIGSGAVTALYVHLAEGVPDDDRSRGELAKLVDLGLLTKATVVIHGTALTADMLGQLKDAGAKLVWSPQSNLRLYGQTTQAAKALELGIPMGLGADWLPSGSQSLLAELKVARRTLVAQGTKLSPVALNEKLVRMVTDEAAEIAGLRDWLGKLEAGRPADVVVLERHRDDPWENVVEAEPSWVQLVTIGGDLAYGRSDWIRDLAAPSELEDVIAWGKQMVIDTTYRAIASGTPPPSRLAELRAKLLARHPQTGPIFA